MSFLCVFTIMKSETADIQMKNQHKAVIKKTEICKSGGLEKTPEYVAKKKLRRILQEA